MAHGVVLMPLKGRLYAQWQTSAKDEDGRDTHVVYSVSDDGESWLPPILLAPTHPNGIRTSGGWWTDGETLVAARAPRLCLISAVPPRSSTQLIPQVPA